jgi:hypothetical protein
VIIAYPQLGVLSNPVRVDPVGTTTQPVSISGGITANIGTTNGLALDATLTGGTQKTKLVDSAGTNLATISAAGALKVDGSAVTQPVSGTLTVTQATGTNLHTTVDNTVAISAASLPLPTGAATETSLAKLPLAQASTTSGQSGILIQGAVATAAPTYTTGQTSPLSLTVGGALRVDASASAVTVSQATAANLNATVVQSTAANLRAQTASEGTIAAAAPTVGSLTMGSVTTSAPTYTTATANALSLTTAGALRVDGSGVTQPVSGTVTVTQATGTNLHAVIDGTTAISASTLPLPTGAATAAKQPSLGTAGTPSTDVLTVQGAVSMTPLKTDGSGVTQPISYATPTVATLLTAQVNAAPANGSTSIIAAVAGKTIRIHRIFFTSSAATTFKFQHGPSGTYSDYTPFMSVGQTGALVFDLSSEPWFVTGTNEDFVILTSGSNTSQLSGLIYYTQS